MSITVAIRLATRFKYTGSSILRLNERIPTSAHSFPYEDLDTVRLVADVIEGIMHA
jgi:hypothetical protein